MIAFVTAEIAAGSAEDKAAAVSGGRCGCDHDHIRRTVEKIEQQLQSLSCDCHAEVDPQDPHSAA